MVRLKTRYLLFELLFPDSLQIDRPESVHAPKTKIDYRKVSQAVKEAILNHFGEQGLGAVQGSLLVKYFSPATMTGILRVGRDHCRLAQAALTYITEIDNQPVIVKVARVSGTIKKSQQAAIARDKSYNAILAAETATSLSFN